MKWLSRSYTWVVMTFLYAPILVLIAYSFNANKSRGIWTGFTFHWYKELLGNSLIMQSLVNTLIIAVISSLLATLLGTMAALGLHGMRGPSKSLIMNITYLPVINPEIVTGVSLMLLFVLFRLEFGFTTLILAHITFNVPYVILNVLPKLRQMDPNLYEAAEDLGCPPVPSFFRVVLPEIAPGVITGLLMSFTFSLDDFIISYFVSGTTSQTLPITIYSMTRKKVSPEINALSAIIFVVVLVVLIIVNINDARIEKKNRRKVGDSFEKKF
mgnify:CR=1 FL=1